jgi:hypothetical protein
MPTKKARSNYSRGNFRVASERAVSHRRHRCLRRGTRSLGLVLGASADRQRSQCGYGNILRRLSSPHHGRGETIKFHTEKASPDRQYEGDDGAMLM